MSSLYVSGQDPESVMRCQTRRFNNTWGMRQQWYISRSHRQWSICATIWQNQQSDCTPSEDSDQPGHPPSLISLLLSAWRNLGMPRLIWVFAGRTLILLVLSCHGSIMMIVWGQISIHLHKNTLWYSLELPRRGDSNEYPQHDFMEKYRKLSLIIVKYPLYLCLR